ncbi:Glyoxalase/Bleomycin resistance protein/Dioxygenase superfamily protein [Paenibacillus sophorae]|uniref:Glyoxalase/Bleomycin resistance protein/Dioxygenase superfamily protein n=1 Tax=Paenibacillus sophorae TaxID=1333845 RepID=A0A1H8W0C5_9BACL|nr:VOC family protein [Paenibacillus sophorae]QWU15460.1 VOC family protein [Paenibacillus sophorae]SEP21099.1 Glyoxalase/Bleomycin resistance protein/Dioxygenase superfamily protein [Paenibacillus sophorae]
MYVENQASDSKTTGASKMNIATVGTFTFDHMGLSVADLDAQRRFYGKALGLVEEEEHFEMPEAKIRSVILRAPDGLKIELIERGESKPQKFKDPFDASGTQGYFHWALYVKDLEKVYSDILAAGAVSVSPPADAVRPGARFAYVKDPEGNLIELIQPAAGDKGTKTN